MDLKKELKSFQNLWKGGTARPKLGWKKSAELAKFQDLNGIVKTCINPYVNNNTTVLEIGAGGGFWTQKMLHAKEIFCLDALSAKHNKFWSRIKKQDNIKYFKVEDFSCNELINNSINYVFSYDVFCHISYSGAEAYLKNMYKKLKRRSNCFIMIADANKYFDINGRKKLTKYAGFSSFEELVKDYDGPPVNGRWYFYGIELFCNLLEKYNYEIVSKDVATEIDKLNPIIHFRKK